MQYIWPYIQAEIIRAYIHTYIQTGRQSDIHTYIHKYRHTARQAERHTYIYMQTDMQREGMHT